MVLISRAKGVVFKQRACVCVCICLCMRAYVVCVCALREHAGVNCKHLKLVRRVGLCDIVCLSLNDCWPCRICEHKSVTMLRYERQMSPESQPGGSTLFIGLSLLLWWWLNQRALPLKSSNFHEKEVGRSQVSLTAPTSSFPVLLQKCCPLLGPCLHARWKVSSLMRRT